MTLSRRGLRNLPFVYQQTTSEETYMSDKPKGPASYFPSTEVDPASQWPTGWTSSRPRR